MQRQVFVLTPEEKKAVCFVVLAFLLGLVSKYYRDHHPVHIGSPPNFSPAKANVRSTRPMPSPSPSSADDESSD